MSQPPYTVDPNQMLTPGGDNLVQGPTRVRYCFYRPRFPICRQVLYDLHNPASDWTTRKYHIGCLAFALGPVKAARILKDRQNGIFHRIASLQLGEEDLDVPFEIIQRRNIEQQQQTITDLNALLERNQTDWEMMQLENEELRASNQQLIMENERLIEFLYEEDPRNTRGRMDFLPDSDEDEVPDLAPAAVVPDVAESFDNLRL